MIKTKRQLFCEWVRLHYPELYAHCERKENDEMYESIDRFVVKFEVMLYLISKAVCYPHTPTVDAFFNKSNRKQKKYIKNLHQYIVKNPEVTTFCLL